MADIQLSETGSVIKTAYEAEANAYTDAKDTKLAGIETAATADQTDAQIKTAYENNSDTNEYSDAEQTKLSGIETAATADQTDAQIKTAYENNSDTNEFSDAEQTKLAGLTTFTETVIVQVKADLPTPSVGVITLASGVGYLIMAEIDLGTDKIDVDGAAFVYGFASSQAKLETNNAGALLNGGTGGTLRMRDITLENTNGSGTIFDFQGSDTEIVLLRNIVPVAAGGGLGTFDRVAVFALTLSNLIAQTGGLTLTNTNAPTSVFPICIVEDNLISQTSGTFLDFGTSRWNSIAIESNSTFNIASGASGVVGAASDANFTTGFGVLMGNNFSGTGTYLTNIASTDLRWEFQGNTGNSGTGNSRTFGDLVMERNTTSTTITAVGTNANITAFADAGGGDVTVTTANSFSGGETVWIVGTTSYDGEYVIQGTPTGSEFDITATFVSNDATGVWETNWTKLGGTTIEKDAVRTTMTDDFEMTLNQLTTEFLDVSVNMSVQADGGGTKDYELGIFINGTRCFGSLSSITTSSNASHITMECVANFVADDVVDIRVRNTTDTTNFLVVDTSLVVN